jgi:hypothetical protein
VLRETVSSNRNASLFMLLQPAAGHARLPAKLAAALVLAAVQRFLDENL